MEGLKILPIKAEEEKFKPKRELHPHLPNVYRGELLTIVAPVCSGKSVFWNNLILRDDMFKDLFSEVVIISPTAAIDASSRFAYKLYKNNCHSVYNDSIITDFCENQKAKIDSDMDSSYCILLDDICGQFSKTGKKGLAVVHFFSRFRHFVRPLKGDACLCLLSTQKYKDVPPLLRVNNTGLFISGNIRSRGEMKAIVSDWADTYGGEKKFLELYDQVKNVPYAFLYLKLNATGGPEAYLNFEKLLYKHTQSDKDDKSKSDKEDSFESETDEDSDTE